ncbi:MAG: CDP-diacylglycerol--serine O-phosphatidyltransferase, partial [Gammaproteobacteria bacterium]
RGYFMGVPTPAGAGLVLLPLIHSFLGFNWGTEHLHAAAIYTGIIGALMVSGMPTFSLKQLNLAIERRYYLRFFILFVLIVLLIINFLWQFISVIGALYFLSLPVSAFAYYKSK